MSLTTFSQFNYGHKITSSNQYLDFSENGIDELFATLPIGSLTLGDFVDAVSNGLNEAGNNTYTVTLNRTTGKVTVASTVNFSLYVTSGSHSAIGAFFLLGFTTNRSGASSYVADLVSGYVYYPQYVLQKFVNFDDFVTVSESSVNTSASGVVEVISFGENRFMECNITYATDIIGQGAIKNNASGVAALRQFMAYLAKKNPVEFVADVDNAAVFTSCIQEKNQGSGDGTGYRLYELYSKNLIGYFETGMITFREV